MNKGFQKGNKFGIGNAFKNAKIEIKCENCGKMFIDFRGNKRKFCSRKCKYDFSKGKLPKNFKLVEYMQKNGKSLKAYKFPEGEKHPNWKGGNSSKAYRLRRTQRWKDWRKAVFERDSYTCQKCGAKSGKDYDGKVLLEPHHRIRVIDLFKNNFIKYIFDVKNGITLCCSCHKNLHRRLCVL